MKKAVVAVGALTLMLGGCTTPAAPAPTPTPTPVAAMSVPPIPKVSPRVDTPGCPTLPEIRYYGYAWNAQMGVMYATGGKQAVVDSLMCKHGVNLKLFRQDDNSQLQALLSTFAERLKTDQFPKEGATFVNIMGDGSAAFLKPLNDALRKISPDETVAVVGATGFSRGEDKFMGPAAWKADPNKAKGGVVAGVLRDGDWNIALKWLGDHKIKNNPDEKTWDPDALNWIGTNDYVEAAQKYVSGYCADMKNIKTGATEKHCVDGVVTWTPGDVTVAEGKGGIVSIVSTLENRTQMPAVVIGNKKWMAANPKIVEGFLAAAFEGADAVNATDDNLQKAADVSAEVYGEKDAPYWGKYFKPQKEKDKTGAEVDLGGSAVINLADNGALFGLTAGSKNDFATTYTVFGGIVHSQYPKLLDKVEPVAEVQDLTYLKALLAAPKPAATVAPKEPGALKPGKVAPKT